MPIDSTQNKSKSNVIVPKDDSKVLVKLEMEKKYNVGPYASETYKISIEGPYDSIKEGREIPVLVSPTFYNMGALITVTKKKLEGKNVEEITKCYDVEVIEKVQTQGDTK